MGDAYVYAEDDEGGYPIPELPDRDETISKMWSVYLERAKKVDMETIDEFKGEADGILIFTGLFSATIATFLVDSYKALQPDPNAEMVLYLAQIAAQLDGTSPSSLPQPPPFRPSAVSVRVNILWFISLCLSLAVALTAVMIQSWCRRYTQLSQRSQPVPGLQARIRVFLFDGMERYRMEDLVGVMPSILHAAVLLFLIGIVDFLFPINATVAASVLVFVVLIAAYLIALTLSPLARLESPYSTPFSWILWRVLSFLSSLAHLEIPKLPSTRHDPVEGDPRVPPRRRFYLGPRSTVVHTLAQQQSVRSAEIRALFSAVDTSPPLSPPDAVAFLDGLAFSLEPPAVPPFPDDNTASASAAAVLSAGHACLHSISRTLLPRATHVRPFLRLCYALQRATINTDRSLVRETLFPLYVRPCMSPALERALEQQPLGPEPHVAVMARVLLAHHVLAELDVRVRFGSPHTRGHHHPPPSPPPHHSLMPVPTSDSGGGGGGGGLSTVLTIIEDVLELNQWTTTEQLMVCGVMIEDCVRAATRARLDPADADGAQAVFLRVRAAAARLAEEREGQVSFVELGRQLKKLEAMLGVDGGGGGGAKDGKCAEQVVKIEKFHRHLS